MLVAVTLSQCAPEPNQATELLASVYRVQKYNSSSMLSTFCVYDSTKSISQANFVMITANFTKINAFYRYYQLETQLYLYLTFYKCNSILIVVLLV